MLGAGSDASAGDLVHLCIGPPGLLVCGEIDYDLSTVYRREATCPTCLDLTPEGWVATAPKATKEPASGSGRSGGRRRR